MITITQPTIVAPIFPTVTYDLKEKLITATVIVSWDSVLGDLVVQAPIISIPGPGTTGEPSIWTVLWEAKPDPATLSSASFDSQGILIPALNTSMPFGVSLLSLEPVSSPDGIEVTLENDVTSDGSLNYTVSVTGTRIGEGQPRYKQHDPTIVVTQEPIG